MNTAAFSKPILLVGRINMNRAVDGDVVAVELLPESDWKAPTDEVIDQDGEVFVRLFFCIGSYAISTVSSQSEK